MKIKDGRKRGWFWGQNEIFDVWGKYLKPNGIAVYLCLCRHANQDYEAWPGYGTIRDECGMSRRTAIRTIKQLIDLGLITCTPREKNDGSDNSNLYTILDISKVTLPSPKKPSLKKSKTKSDGSVIESLGGSDTESLGWCHTDTTPSDTQTLPLVTHRHSPSDTQTPEGNLLKETKLKDTNLRTTTTTTNNLSSGEILEKSSSNSKEIIKGNKKPTVLAAVESVQDSGLVFDYALKDFSSEQKQRALNLLKDVPTEDKQSVLDEFNSAIEQGTVKSIWRYFSKLIQNYHAGQFNSTSELPKKRAKTQSESKSTENTQQQIRECPYCNDGGTLSFEFPDNRFMTKPCNHNHEEIISFITKYNVKFDFPSNIFTPTQYPQNYKEIVSIITKHNAKMASSDRFNHTKPTQSIETKPLSKSQAQAKLAAMIGGFQKE
jgi:hypothetical protein